MLEIRPNCENCNCDLSPDSNKAMICSYECTFCSNCVENILEDVCPNCGGGFTPRPVRVQTAWREGVSLQYQPASDTRVHKPVNVADHAAFTAHIKTIPPQDR